MSTLTENKRPAASLKLYHVLGLTIFIGLSFFFLEHSLYSVYFVPSSSMSPSLISGDSYLVNKTAYGIRTPFSPRPIRSMSIIKRGDIIVFQNPTDLKTDYVKRVIGIAGDHIRIKGTNVFINDVALRHQQIKNSPSQDDPLEIIFSEQLDGLTYHVKYQKPHRLSIEFEKASEFMVPEGAVFVLGDNRSTSDDSRSFGKVPVQYIKGKATMILWSINRETSTRIRWSRIFKAL